MAYVFIALIICVTIVTLLAMFRGQHIRKIKVSTGFGTFDADFYEKDDRNSDEKVNINTDEKEKVDDAANITDRNE